MPPVSIQAGKQMNFTRFFINFELTILFSSISKSIFGNKFGFVNFLNLHIESHIFTPASKYDQIEWLHHEPSDNQTYRTPRI